MRTRELQGKQTMLNTVATPILTIKAIAVNKDFWNEVRVSVLGPLGIFHNETIFDQHGRVVLDKCLPIFDNVRADSEELRRYQWR